MKTNHEPPDNVVVTKIFDIQKVGFLPNVKENTCEHSDYILAYLLTTLKTFDDWIFLARKELEIIDIYSYSNINSYDKLFDLLYSLGQEKHRLLKQKAIEIVESYKLGDQWILSIQTAIVTDTLPIPAIVESIQIETTETIFEYDRIHFSIRINNKITTNELSKWIKQNKGLIRLCLKSLPSRKIPKVNVKTITWGHIAWIFKKANIHSWTKMTEFIQNKIDNLGPIYGETLAPEATDMERYYKRFVMALKNIEK